MSIVAYVLISLLLGCAGVIVMKYRTQPVSYSIITLEAREVPAVPKIPEWKPVERKSFFRIGLEAAVAAPNSWKKSWVTFCLYAVGFACAGIVSFVSSFAPFPRINK